LKKKKRDKNKMVIETEKLIAGIIMIALGLLFFFNNKNIGKGASKFYKAFYTERNLKVLFRIVGVILIIVAVILILF